MTDDEIRELLERARNWADDIGRPENATMVYGRVVAKELRHLIKAIEFLLAEQSYDRRRD